MMPKEKKDEVVYTMKFLAPDALVSEMIGKAGANVRKLVQETSLQDVHCSERSELLQHGQRFVIVKGKKSYLKEGCQKILEVFHANENLTKVASKHLDPVFSALPPPQLPDVGSAVPGASHHSDF